MQKYIIFLFILSKREYNSIVYGLIVFIYIITLYGAHREKNQPVHN